MSRSQNNLINYQYNKINSSHFHQQNSNNSYNDGNKDYKE